MARDGWWIETPGEKYWLEITDRTDLGTDLNAPERDDEGNEYWGYSLISDVARDDVVFHYHKPRHAIVAASRAADVAWRDEVVWGAHGTTARGAGVQPYARPGWRLALENFVELPQPITLEALRLIESAIASIRDRVAGEHPRQPLYFPFELSAKRPLRPTQAYLTKFPQSLVGVIPGLAQGERSQTIPPPQGVGGSYRAADEDAAVSSIEPVSVDPGKLERALRSHARTQNALAEYLQSTGHIPRSPIQNEPSYDLAWKSGDTVFVAEVKSLPPLQEESQLRIGLGQVLRYRHSIQQLRPNDRVVAVLVPEHEPSDDSWSRLCEELKVILVWPDAFGALPNSASGA